MTQTVSLIRNRSGFANVADSFSVAEAGIAIDELNQEVATYVLPDGFVVAPSNMMVREIYAPDGRHCEIIEHNGSGNPQLVFGDFHNMPVLRLAI